MTPTPYRYLAPRGDQLAAALNLVFAGVDAEERRRQIDDALARSASGDPLLGLVAATCEDSVVGAVWAAPQAGRTATLWPPQADKSHRAGCTDELLRRALAALYGGETQLIHALLPLNAPETASLVSQHGFELGATLYYMTSLRADFPIDLPASALSYEPYSEEIHRRFAELVEATYEGSLDCPQLDGRRHVDDVLTGYRANGRFDSNLWRIVRREERDVGVLLLCDWPGAGYYELVYMGLAPAERGRGYGIEIVRHAQWLTGRAGRDHLLLAVDAANAPALRMYERAGFACWDRRQAYLACLNGDAGAPNRC